MEKRIIITVSDDASETTTTEVVVPEGHGSDLCHDDWSGRWFYSSVVLIERAMNQLNHQILTDGEATLNDLYDQLGLGPTSVGEIMGWSGETVEARFTGVISPDGRPGISFFTTKPPQPNRNA